MSVSHVLILIVSGNQGVEMLNLPFDSESLISWTREREGFLISRPTQLDHAQPLI